MLNKDSFWLLPIIATIVAIGPLSTDMYLPAQPAMKLDLGANIDQVQLTLSIFLIGIAIAQPIWGPLADRYGRKPIIFYGMAIFVLATLACAYAPSIEFLIAARFFQAFGGCVGPTLGRTVVRDMYGVEHSAKAFSYLTSIMALAPAVAPMIGGLLVSHFDWRAIFLALMVLGLLSTILYAVNVSESLPKSYQQAIEIKSIIRNYFTLFKDRAFIAYMLIVSFIFSGLFSFISGASVLFMEFLGLSETQFGYCFITMVFGFISGAMTSARLSAKLHTGKLLLLGISVSSFGAIACFSLAYFKVYHVAALVFPIAFYAYGVGLVMPQSSAAALKHYAHMAGTASSLIGTIQNTIAAIAGIGVAFLYNGTPLVMASFLCFGAGAALLTYFFFLPKSEKSHLV